MYLCGKHLQVFISEFIHSKCCMYLVDTIDHVGSHVCSIEMAG